MTIPDKKELIERLTPFGQTHLAAFFDELNDDSQRQLAEQILAVDFEELRNLVQATDNEDWAERARRAEPPKAITLHGRGSKYSSDEATRRGEAALEAGEVGMILVAGGMGTRLEFEAPKGMFPIGPVSNRSLFQVHTDRLRALALRYGRPIPLYVMTSSATHRQTVEFLLRHARFGLSPDDLTIFRQADMPAVETATGKVILAEKSSLFLSPDGHGGMLSALSLCGALAGAEKRGIQHLFYGQIDNPLLQVCDPTLIGRHILEQSEMTTQVVRRTDPNEKVGVLASVGGQTCILEYSDMPKEIAGARESNGSLRLWAGNTAVHVFDLPFLVRAAAEADSLPFHKANKKASYIDDDGRQVVPELPNATKFERFIFDLLPLARKAIAVEAEKADAFAPVKNKDGAAADTPADARAAMIARDRRRLVRAGVQVKPGVAVEINPLFALDVEELAGKVDAEAEIVTPTYFA